MNTKTNILVLVSTILFLVGGEGLGAPNWMYQVQPDTIPSDTIPTDSVKPYEPTYTPTFQPSYRFGDPFSNRMSPTPLQLSDPSSIDLQVEYDSGINYTVYERIGDVNFRPMSTMSFEEYDAYNDQQIVDEYFKERSAGLDGESAVSGRSLIPRLYVGPVFDRLFGGSYVDIQPNGFVNLDFGGRFQRINNPAIPLRQQRNGGFNFNQQISLNVVGKVGEKLAITANFDNNNTFDFQNNLKVEYTGYEEDIVKKIEIGNVSMPVSNSLMTGAQSLFGIKTQLQFGRLFVTSVLSRQQGQSEVLTIESGFQGREFEVRASDYDENRHFFLGHFFRENYENWLGNLPQITSGVNITRVEVYLINRTQDTRTTRNVVGFMDLGEGDRIYRKGDPNVGNGQGQVPTNNSANNLYQSIVNTPGVRSSSEASGVLQNSFGFTNSADYVLIQTARKLEDNEFTINKKLGYITLLRKLQNDEALAVSYEYTYNGQVYKVGELTEDYSGLSDDQVIFMKLLRPNKINTKVPSWDLMMKNIYNLNASQVEPNGFTLRVHYRDDRTGIDNPSLHEGRLTKDKPLIELMGLDQLNRNNDRQKDGNFDFIEDVTIDTRNGNIIFPVLEPFGDQLREYFDPVAEANLIEKYVFDTLYATTRADAQQVASQNKYFILGRFNAGSSSEIVLPGINIAENSVVVTAGNTPLTEGLDYTVDYNLGRVRIINEGILSSGKTINISYEKADLFNFQSRWLYGTRLDYRFSDNFNIGATLLHLNERPGGVSRYKIGDEPTSNTKYGFDLNFQTEANFLTKMVDAIPLVSTKESSTIRFNAEFAQMIPGTSNIVDGEGTSYIDDFENAITPFSLAGGSLGWDLAATPRTKDNQFDLSQGGSALGYNYKKAKIAWYIVDQNFYNESGLGFNQAPDNLDDDDLNNHYVRPILPQEIYRQRDRTVFQTPERIFDIAYFPSERGQYNFNPNLTPDGLLPDPKSNWGGITRAITNEVDFDKTNVEYLEFWLMDPFIQGERGRVIDGIFNTNNTTGGELVFNLGSVSEDLMKDNGRHAFENGLPVNDDSSRVDFNEWGRITTEPFLINYFDNAKQQSQDVGLDGLDNEGERQYFRTYLDQLSVSGTARERIESDPAGDDFRYFLGESLDNEDAKIIERYKNFNGLDGNSPPQSGNGTVQQATNIPDNEDLNLDNTISELEEYYEYRIPLEPGQLDIGYSHIVDKISDPTEEATWYLFRIPIRDPDNIIGDINGFKTMRYVRMYLTEFQQPVVLRMAKLQLVGSQWRKYQEALTEPGLYELPETSTSDFNVSVVSIEENSTGSDTKSRYVVPPGISRDRDNTTIVNRQVNEQSLQVCIEDIQDQDARSVFKNVNLDLINYGRLKMFFHAEVYKNDMVLDDEVTAFLRLGTDFTENYYEIEVPLKITPLGVTGTDDELARLIWPLENEINLAIDELLSLKSERNRGQFDNQVPYQRLSRDGKYNLTVKGRPDISTILTMMIGVRNPKSDDKEPKSVCLWANELRVTEFDKTKGWAANANLSAKLADLGTINASTRYTSVGFGSIQENIQQRDREEALSYDVSANLNLEKFLLPEKTGLRVPMYASYEKSRITPHFDPLDPDVPLEASLASINSPVEREEYRKLVEDRRERRSLNFTNVGKEKVNPDAKSHFFDIENISLSYAYSDAVTSNVSTETYLQKNESGGVAYNYAPSPFVIEPFKSTEAFKSPWLKLIKDINFSPVPSNVSFRADLNRSFIMTQLYDDNLSIEGIEPYYERLFTFSRNYSLRWNPIKNLNLDYSAVANAVIDEDSTIEGDINTQEEKDYIWEQIKNLGRMKNFRQDVNATFRVPLDKLPLTDWLSTDLKYAVGYNWVAGSRGQNDSEGNFFGHTISNRRDRGLSSKVDMVKLYNKVKFLKEINAPPRRRSSQESSGGFSPGKSFLRLLMSLRSVTANYNIRESTTLSGFIVSPFLFGMDSSWNAPGWDFILGSQDADIRFDAASNGWMTRSKQLTAPFQQTFNTDLDLRASIEPTPDFKISLDAKRTNSASFQEIFRMTDSLGYQGLTPARSGSYNISYLSIKTAFTPKEEDNTSAVYEQFAENIDIIHERLKSPSAGSAEYNRLSQDVLIPAFLAAYSGQDANSSSLSPFPRIPIPNWRVDYTGLSKMPALKEIFSSVSLTHGYRSVYNVNNYTNSLRYDNNVSLDNNIIDYPRGDKTDSSNILIPVYIINQVSIAEQFSPFLGLNIRTKKNLSTRIEYKKERNLSLNMSNAQITEVSNNDITLDFGLTKEDFKLPFKIQGRTIALENDVTIRVSLTIRDSETIQRKLEGENTVTNGSTNFQFRPSLSYKLNDKLDLTMYFERSVTDPKISSFRTATTAFGTQLRFGLSQ